MSGFDREKHLVSRRTAKVVLMVEGDELELTVRADYNGKPNIPWSVKNQIISQAMRWDTDGNGHFDSDLYLREVLKQLIIEAPWGTTDDVFLSQVSDSLGAALEELAPKAFASDKQHVRSADDVKKESSSSSEVE